MSSCQQDNSVAPFQYSEDEASPSKPSVESSTYIVLGVVAGVWILVLAVILYLLKGTTFGVRRS